MTGGVILRLYQWGKVGDCGAPDALSYGEGAAPPLDESRLLDSAHRSSIPHYTQKCEDSVFQGKFEHTLDDKGRLAVPSPFRRLLGAEDASESSVVVTISDQCLAAYPETEWQGKLAAIAKLNQLDPRVMAFKRIFIGCAQECAVDKAGRILVPEGLRRDAGIEKECVVIGQLEKFEIWSAERWSRSFNQLTDQVGAIYASLADFGVQI